MAPAVLPKGKGICGKKKLIKLRRSTDVDLGILKVFFNTARRAVFHNLAQISGKLHRSS